MLELKMPLTQIYDLYTKSELAIMSWASQDQVADLGKTPKKSKRLPRRKSADKRLSEELTGEEYEEIEYAQEQPTGLPKRFYNAQGELDLSKLKGLEAVKYMGKMGIHFLPIFKG